MRSHTKNVHNKPAGPCSFILRLLDSGVGPDMNPEQELAANNANLFYLLAFLLSLFMLFEVVRQAHFFLLPLPCALLCGSLLCFIRVARSGKPYYPSLALFLGLTLSFFALTAAGGTTGTGFIWLFALPVLAFRTFPVKTALALFLLPLASVAVFFFFSEPAALAVEYTPRMQARIAAAYVFSGGIAAAGSFIRWKSKLKMDSLVEKLIALSQIDQLTGLYNRRAFQERFHYERARAARDGYPLALVMLDIDHFKTVNDDFGHNCGDQALRELGRVISPLLRKQDTFARWGGEEFILLLPNTSGEGGKILADRLRAAVEAASFTCDGHTLRFTISLGVYQCDGADSMDACFSEVDANLYRAKHLGRNRVC